MIRYRSSRPPEIELRAKLRDLANERCRYGYRRLFVLLRRDGEPSGVNRIYREEGLSVRKRKARRRAVGTRAPILVEAKANARWSLDFVHDQFACGRRFRILNVVDDVTRECLAAIADTSISGHRVARELTTLVERRGKLGMQACFMVQMQPRQTRKATPNGHPAVTSVKRALIAICGGNAGS